MATIGFECIKDETVESEWNSDLKTKEQRHVLNESGPKDCQNEFDSNCGHPNQQYSQEAHDPNAPAVVWPNNSTTHNGSVPHYLPHVSSDNATAGPWDGISSEIDLISTSTAIPEGRVVGVYFDKQRRIWRANWREGGVGRRKTKNFSVDDYGFEEARRLAIQYRLLKIMEASDKQMFNNHESEQALWLSQVLKRKTEKKTDTAPAKRKKQRRYNLSNHSLLRSGEGSAPVWADSIEAQMELQGYTGGISAESFSPGCEVPVYMMNYGYDNAAAYYSPRGAVANTVFPGMWCGSPGSKGNQSLDETDYLDFVDGIPAESLYVVSSTPWSDDPENEMTFQKSRDLSTTADTGSSDEVDDGCPAISGPLADTI